MQYFKGDEKEIKMAAVASSIFEARALELDEFFENAFTAYPLGDLLWTENRAPLSNAILQSIFRISFPEIVDAFVVAGSFESYLSVFRKIFGEEVEVTFVVPAPGKLEINVTALGFELSEFITRYIEDNAYVFDTIIDDEDDTIVFQTVKGFQTQYELERMLYEMVPAGIYTEITLSVGEEE
jgi:hypothetical protein